MVEFLFGAAALIVLVVVIGLVRVIRGPGDVDRVMAVQLVGTGGIAALLLSAIATGVPALIDLALMMALLSGFASIAFVKAGKRDASGREDA